MKSIPFRWIVLPFAIFVFVSPVSLVEGQVFDWTKTTNIFAFYEEAVNWTAGGPPDSTQGARFNADAEYEVWWDGMTGNQDVDRLSVTDGQVTFLNSTSGTTRYKLDVVGSTGIEIFGGSTVLTLSGIELESSGSSFIGTRVDRGASLVVDGFHSAGASLTSSRSVQVLGEDSNIQILRGGMLTSDFLAVSIGGGLLIDGVGSLGTSSNSLLVVSGTVDITGGGRLETSGASDEIGVGEDAATVNVIGSGSVWQRIESGRLFLGNRGTGNLNIFSQGIVNTPEIYLGGDEGSVGNLRVHIDGSLLTEQIIVGDGNGIGNATVSGRGVISSSSGILGSNQSAQLGSGNVLVTGSGSRWDMTEGLDIYNGVLNIERGGVVSNVDGLVGEFNKNGVVNVTDSSSRWENSGELNIGTIAGGTGALNIYRGAVTVGTTTRIGTGGFVDIQNSGRFEFGTMQIEDFNRVNGDVQSSVAGTLLNSGYTDAFVINKSLQMSDVMVENAGTLHGSTTTGASIVNQIDSEIQTFAGEQMRFGGTGINMANAEINNFGGLVRFDGSLTNEADGFIGGQGTFIANGGLDNSGIIAVTGNSNILGDVTMNAGSQLVTSGFATTTMFDDLVHNGAEIRTSTGSALILLGGATGAGDYTGTGTVFFEGDLRPGNSPDIVNFEGDVVLGSFANTFIELGGESLGLFDQLLIDGSLDLDGALAVNLIDGFTLSNDMQFLFADVGGGLSGQFNGLSEGDLVGTFDSQNLFITYQGFNGNSGVGLFTTAVPEPSSFVLLGSLLTFTLLRRRRRDQ